MGSGELQRAERNRGTETRADGARRGEGAGEDRSGRRTHPTPCRRRRRRHGERGERNGAGGTERSGAKGTGCHGTERERNAERTEGEAAARRLPTHSTAAAGTGGVPIYMNCSVYALAAASPPGARRRARRAASASRSGARVRRAAPPASPHATTTRAKPEKRESETNQPCRVRRPAEPALESGEWKFLFSGKKLHASTKKKKA